MEWQPIETAPKDGTNILIAWDAPTPEFKAVGVGKWDTSFNYGWESETYSNYHIGRDATHWMPLPKQPKKG